MKVAILGAGNWGTTLAIRFHAAGHDVLLWEFNADLAKDIKYSHRNEVYLPGFEISPEIEISSRLDDVADAEILFLAIPAQACRSVLKQLQNFRGIVVSLIKGIEQETLQRVSEVCEAELSGFSFDNYAVLSGPTIAIEIANGLPASAVVASYHEATAIRIQKEFSSSGFRLYRSSDVIGVELAGALKNVIALAAGICDGMKLGANTKGALLTRGLAEISRLSEALGGNRSTFSGLSGLGDLVTTCESPHSRNRQFGERIAKGESFKSILASSVMVAEGVWTARAARDLAVKSTIEMPIANSVCQILFENKNVKDALRDLMERDLKAEN